MMTSRAVRVLPVLLLVLAMASVMSRWLTGAPSPGLAPPAEASAAREVLRDPTGLAAWSTLSEQARPLGRLAGDPRGYQGIRAGRTLLVSAVPRPDGESLGLTISSSSGAPVAFRELGRGDVEALARFLEQSGEQYLQSAGDDFGVYRNGDGSLDFCCYARRPDTGRMEPTCTFALRAEGGLRLLALLREWPAVTDQ